MYGLVKVGDYAWNAYQVSQAEHGKTAEGTLRTTLYMSHPEDEPLQFFGAEAVTVWAWVVNHAEDITPTVVDGAVKERAECIR